FPIAPWSRSQSGTIFHCPWTARLRFLLPRWAGSTLRSFLATLQKPSSREPRSVSRSVRRVAARLAGDEPGQAAGQGGAQGRRAEYGAQPPAAEILGQNRLCCPVGDRRDQDGLGGEPCAYALVCQT